MKKLIVLLLILNSFCVLAQKIDFHGVYIAQKNDTTFLTLVIDNYLSQNTYTKKQYIGTRGGVYNFDGKNLSINLEFNDKNTDEIGKTIVLPIQIIGSKIEIDNLSYQKINSNQQDLDGLWRITGRKSGETINTIQRGDRKTIKILVDGYFQWIAINPKEKGFYGTGGGIYKFENGKYSETILFFSRDNTRVGATLTFDGKMVDSNWHHSGLSSKGDPIFEIWSKDK